MESEVEETFLLLYNSIIWVWHGEVSWSQEAMVSVENRLLLSDAREERSLPVTQGHRGSSRVWLSGRK